MADINSFTENSQIFVPSENFVSKANLNPNTYATLCKKANDDYLGFWGDLAKTYINWHRIFTQILDDSKKPFYKWFVDGSLNVSYNCLDRHLKTIPDKVAIIFEADDGASESVTYRELHKQVCKFANGLKSLGVKNGDRVIIYMSNSIEAIVAMQSCARIGAIHSVVFAGFSAHSLADRIIDARAQYLVTVDGSKRGGKVLAIKQDVDAAITILGTDSPIKNIIIQKVLGLACKIVPKFDVWWHDLVLNQSDICEPEWVLSSHPLFILYTSGSTGKPKGVEHSSAGYLLGAIITMLWVFDYKDSDCFWCTADVGWITGHTYVCYGPLALGATQVIFSGTPLYPDASSFWRIIQRHRVSVFYTAPTAIRSLIKAGGDLPLKFDLSSLRLLGSVGEPINPEAWKWYYTLVGKEHCPIVDTWWQTETGCHMLAPIPGVSGLKPGSCCAPLPGICAGIIDENGHNVGLGGSGYLVIKKPFPMQLKTIWGDNERYKTAYYPGEISGSKHYYVAGDSAHLDSDGYFWILGRIDDVLNVSGHRIGTAEIESALVSHKAVAEAAVVGKFHEIKGESLFAFVVCKNGFFPAKENLENLKEELCTWVATQIGAIAKPDDIRFVEGLPKTRSGKIMRRILRNVANGHQITQDISTLENPAIIELLKTDI